MLPEIESTATGEQNTQSLTFALSQAGDYGLDVDLVFRAIFPAAGDSKHVQSLAAILLRKIDSGNKRVKETKAATGARTVPAVRAHGEIPGSLINYLAVAMTRQCYLRHEAPPAELCRLLETHLKTVNFGMNKTKGMFEFERAAEYRAIRPSASVRAVAEYAGVDGSTVSRWMHTIDFQKSVARIKNDPLRMELLLHIELLRTRVP